MSDVFVTRAAAVDMARIFKPLAGRTPVSASPPDVAANAGRKSVRRRLVILAAPALVGVAAVGLAIGYLHDDGPEARTIAAKTRSWTTPKAGSDRAAQPEAASANALTSPESARMLSVPEDEPSPASRAAEQKTLPPGSQRERGTNLRHPDASVKSRSEPAPFRVTSGEVAQDNPDRRDSSTGAQRCAPGSVEDRCIYQDVLNADAKLRTAFNRARRNGVSNAQLATIRARWNDARRDADDDPDGTIWRYNQLAATLDRIARSDTE